MRALFLALAAIVVLAMPSGRGASAADRVALVIGVGNYQHAAKLDNTLNDARLIADTLGKVGFDVATVSDPTQAEMLEALAAFAFRSETADLALIYFAGHGVQVLGENYLIPADAVIRSNRDVQRNAVSLTDFLTSVEHARKMRIVILDSCRDSPFKDLIDPGDTAETATATLASRGVGTGGLAAPSPDRGTLVAFAAEGGKVALDGSGANSPFATALSDKLAVPGLEISLMFRQVRDEVLAETANRQEPHVYGSLPGIPFYLAGSPEERKELDTDDKAAAWSKIRPDQQVQLAALAEAGDTRSMYGLALMQLIPNSPKYDPKAAAALLARSADAGAPEAQFELARLYEKGIGVPEDLGRARELYEAAAAQDFPDAVNELGFFYYSGALGLPIDQAKALELFRRAADLKQPEAMFNVASFIDRGLLPGTRPEDAAGYLYQSLRSGSQKALDALSDHPGAFNRDTWRALQARLAENGFYKGTIDGEFGPGTLRSLRAAFGLLETE